MSVKSHDKLIRCAGFFVVAYLACANAFWHYRSPDYLGPATVIDGLFRHLAWLAKPTLFMWFPGWLTVDFIRGGGVATPVTDLLIPILSAMYWGGIGIFILNSVHPVRHNQSLQKLSKIQRIRFIGAIAFLVLFVVSCVCSIVPGGDGLSITLTLSVYSLIVVAFTLAIPVGLFFVLRKLVRRLLTPSQSSPQ